MLFRSRREIGADQVDGHVLERDLFFVMFFGSLSEKRFEPPQVTQIIAQRVRRGVLLQTQVLAVSRYPILQPFGLREIEVGLV